MHQDVRLVTSSVRAAASDLAPADTSCSSACVMQAAGMHTIRLHACSEGFTQYQAVQASCSPQHGTCHHRVQPVVTPPDSPSST